MNECIVIVEHLYLFLQVIHHVEMVVLAHTTTPAIVIMDSVVHVVRYVSVCFIQQLLCMCLSVELWLR